MGEMGQNRARTFRRSPVVKCLVLSRQHRPNMSQIQQFYAGQKIFITGATGFLGKILTEKLLRSCPDIETIYLLIRAKNGKSVQERLDALVANSVFDVLRSEYPNFSNKIVPIDGDIVKRELGLSNTDQARLANEVSVIFHLAATIRFNETLDKAVASNVNGTKAVVDLAKTCVNLKVGVYVSTAYSHCLRKSVNEELYPPPLSYEDVNKLVEDAAEKKWSEDEIKSSQEKVLGDWPNTYSFSKAIAESVIAEYAGELPFAIFRPSIVTNTYKEPIPGWVAGLMGLSGILSAIGLGLVRIFPCKANLVTELVPADYVGNALICCAWETATAETRNDEKPSVYNYVTGKENLVTWTQLRQRTQSFGRIYPSNATIYYPFIIGTPSKLMYAILEFFLHLLPALLVDGILRLFGKQPMLYKVERKIGEVVRSLAYFSSREWDFENERVQNLWRRIGPIDKVIFPFNMQNLDWDEHALQMVKGLRKYIIGDPDENQEQARRRHVYLYIIHVIVCLGLFLLVLWTISKLWIRLHYDHENPYTSTMSQCSSLNQQVLCD